ncbi:MAG TPA: glycosyltransferase family 2 protein [Desulfomonilaceae bacterium]|nr:glycosyltransferase family 2 protein [Desulfomonilaceae bacterium]HVN24630.1 glycosyltransferase family 2 protein [Syntrophorhabdales bacterium]
MDALPLVSVITPAYNRASFLGETIESVLSQDYPCIEYIVLDDGSKDNTRDVLVKYGDRIRWESHVNMGEARTVNRGFEMAKGEILCVVNSDDPLFPGAVSTAVAFMQSRPEILVAYPDWDYIAPDSQSLGHVQVPEYDFLFMVAHHKCIVGPGAFIRRKAVELIGGRDPAFKYVGDFEFWLRLALKGPFGRIPKTLATFRIHPTSASLAMKSAEMAREDIRMIRKFYSRTDLPPEILNIKNIAFSSAHLHASRVSGPARFHSLMHFIAFMAYSPRNLVSEYPAAVARLRPDFYGRGIKNLLGRVIHQVVSTMPFVRR